MNNVLAMPESLFKRIKQHLWSDATLESAALLLCHNGMGLERKVLLANSLLEVPESACAVRTGGYIKYKLENVLTPELIGRLDRDGLSLVTVHSHPGGLPEFSATDDENDRILFGALHKLTDDVRSHGAAIMLPDGSLVARVVTDDGKFLPMDIRVVGARLRFMNNEATASPADMDVGMRLRQAFGQGTYRSLRQLKVGVVGCSGTGSIMTEFLARNCIGELLLVDDDKVERKNLNRIVNATLRDARDGACKVNVLQRAVEAMGTNTKVSALVGTTADTDIQFALKGCDVIFGCVDTAEGRCHLECLTAAYMIPYFDMGVQLVADGNGGLENLLAVAIYSSPDNGGLLGNDAYDLNELAAEGLRRTDRQEYENRVKVGYIKEIDEDQPAVITLNAQAANMSGNDFLARLHGYRLDDDDKFNIQRFDLVKGYYEHTSGKPHKAPTIEQYAGWGDKSILLDWV